MSDMIRCPRCGATMPSRPTDAPCPRCATLSVVLETIEATAGPAPSVLLRDTEGGDEAPVVRVGAGSPAGPAATGRYEILGEIARGGMGVVLKGRDSDLGRDLAVKVLLQEHGDRPEMIRRFVEEAQIGGQLQHPGVVPVYELGTFADGRPFFAMKLVKGRTLADLLESRAGPGDDPPRFLGIFEQVCQTVAYAHARSVIHRDLKPSNIMVGAFGEVQVMDWGLAKVLETGGVSEGERTARRPESIIQTARSGSDADASRAGSVLGTPAYMAPEQARGEVDWLDERADVFGLGAILCEVLTGLPPYAARSSAEALRMAARAEIEEGQARLEACGADPELLALARRCLAVDPRQRPRDAGEVALAMRAYLDGIQERARRAELERAEAQARAVEEKKRRRLAVALAATVVAAWLGGGYAWLASRRARDARLAETGRVVEEALAQAGALLDEARRAPAGALDPWTRAASAAERARGLLAGREAPLGLADRVEATAAGVTHEDRLARERARRDEEDRALVAALDEARAAVATRSGQGWDLNRLKRDYAAAFRRAGIDPESPTAAADVASRPSRVRLAAAFDDWAQREEDPAPRRRLLAIARAADPDPLRNRLRDALAASDRAALAEIADGIDPASLPPSTVNWLASALDKLDDHARALALLRRAHLAHPDDFWIALELGWILDSRRPARPDEAARYQTAALALAPRNVSVLTALGGSLVDAGRLDEAEAVLREAARLRPGFATTHIDLAYLLVRREQFGPAIDEAREAVRLDAGDHAAHNNLGYALYRAGRPGEAVAELSEAIRLAPPHYIHAYLNRALARIAMNEIDEAIEDLGRALAIEPDNVEAHLVLGDVLASRRDFREAIGAYLAAAESSGDPQALRGLASALFEVGRVDESIRVSRRLVGLRPSDAQARNHLAWALANSPDPEVRALPEALEQAREAVRLAPDASHLETLGLAAYRSGRLDEARSAAERAFKSGERPAAGLVLAMVEWRQGRPDRARDVYARAANDLGGMAVVARESLALRDEVAAMIGSPRPEASGSVAAAPKSAAPAAPAPEPDPEMGLSLTIARDPSNPRPWYERALLRARRSRWTEALADLARAGELNPRDEYLWMEAAVLYFWAGDGAAYRRHCLAGLERYGDTADPIVAERAAKACLLSPRPVDDRGRPSRLARLAVDRGAGHRFRVWFELTLGLAEFRDGHFPRAIEVLERCKVAEANTLMIVPADLVLAMAHDRLGHRDEALRHLQSATRAIDARPTSPNGDFGASWHDWLVIALLRREAEATILYDPIFPADPFAR